jgi:hypothetical protein
MLNYVISTVNHMPGIKIAAFMLLNLSTLTENRKYYIILYMFIFLKLCFRLFNNMKAAILIFLSLPFVLSAISKQLKVESEYALNFFNM